MKNGAIYSGLLHLAMFAVIAVGLPELRDPTPLISQPVPVEIVTISPKSNPPKGRERAVKKPPKPEPKKPQARAAEPPKVEPAPKKDPPKPPKKEVAVVPPAPKPDPKPKVKKPDPKPKRTKPRVEAAPEVKPEPKPKRTKPRVEATPEVKPDPPPKKRTTPRVAARPEVKPQPPKKKKAALDFKSMLKNVKKMKSTRRKADRDTAARADPKGSSRHDPTRQLSMSEMDAVRRQLSRCWNVPTGSKDAGKLVVDVKVWMNPDRTVRRAQIVDRSRMSSDAQFRAAAESARRAVLNPRCSPLKLPPDKYETWKIFTVVFDPKDMIGG